MIVVRLLSDALDDILSKVHKKQFSKPKQLLETLASAYTIGAPPLMSVPMTDLLNEAGKHAFHIGTPDPEMRRIAAWIFTQLGRKDGTLDRIITALWQRGGREDFKLISLLLANRDYSERKTTPWSEVFDLLGKTHYFALEVVLELFEEIARAGHPLPANQSLKTWAERGKIEHQCIVLLLTLSKNNDIHRALIVSAPVGGELFERIRDRLLSS